MFYKYRILPIVSLSLLALLFWGFNREINFSKEPGSAQKILFLIEPGQGFLEISENLRKQGLIRNQLAFRIYLLLENKQGQLKAGEYVLSPAMTVRQISQIIYQGEIASVKITIPEGFTLKQIEARLNANFDHKIDFQTQKAKLFQKDFAFLAELAEETPLEGFLFPDTYQFTPQSSQEEIILKMLANFEKRLRPELKQEIANQGKSVFEIVIMASILEKEVKTPEDKKIVAGILWKRLNVEMPLQVDATIVYLTGEKTSQITYEQTRIDSFYNTYKYAGLPPGPVCNPGLESIEAAIYPQTSDHWYYLSTPEGQTIFSETLEKHNLAKIKYLN